MELKFLQFDAEFKADEAKDGIGRISGYGSVFGNKDSYGDIVQKGAFANSIMKKMPAMLLQHNSHDLAGLWTIAREDDRGLYLEGEINLEVQKAKEHYALAKQGALKGLSIGFRTLKDEVLDNGVRLIHDVDLVEVSLVTFPANTAATITQVKSMPDTVRDFEKFLRDAGYSKQEAKSIASHGFKAKDVGRDAQVEAFLEAVKKSIQNLQGN